MNLSQKIVKNRINLEKKIASKYDINEYDLMELFQIPSKVVKQDIKEGEITFTGTKEFDVNKEKHRLYEMADKKANLSKEDALAHVGMWIEPEYFGEKTRNYKGLYKEESIQLGKAVQLARYGFTLDEIKKSLNLGKIDRIFVQNEVKDKGFKNVVFGKGSQNEFADRRKESGDSIEDINRVNGAVKKRLEIGEHSYNKIKEKSKEYQSKYKNNYPDTSNKRKRIYPEEIQKEAYERWTSGECTQKELAEEYNVDRVTIGNWCSKFKDIDIKTGEIDVKKDIPTKRRRNVKREKREAREERNEKILTLYSEYKKDMTHSEAISKISKELGLSGGYGGYSTVLGVLRENGLSPTKFENSRGKKDIPKASENYKDAYALKYRSFFGYGPNAGKTKDRTMSEYQTEVLNNQTELGYELKNNPEAKEYAKKHKGDMSKYFDKKKELASEKDEERC